MRLGYYYHMPAVQKIDGIYMAGVQGRFIDSLAMVCDQVVCFLHSPRIVEEGWMDYKVVGQNVKLVDIGEHASVIRRALLSSTFISNFCKNHSNLDVLLLRGPSPLLPAIADASSIPTALLLVGDYVASINDLRQPWLRKEAIRIWSYWNKWGQNRVVRKSLTFVNSRVLYDELKAKAPYLVEARTTTLTQKDFYFRSDTCQSTPYHLLYVGRMDGTKGLLQMVEAVALLTDRGEDVILDLVGWPEHNDNILNEIDQFVRLHDLEDRVYYHGPCPLGPKLFDNYRKADLFLIGSFFEGFPRAIWEAMANSLPVVATQVGSIPAYIEGAAELIPPGDPYALMSAISKLIQQPSLRQKYIKMGQQLVSQNTLEVQTKE